MQSEPERELISSSQESFESFVLLSRDVRALDREISYLQPSLQTAA